MPENKRSEIIRFFAVAALSVCAADILTKMMAMRVLTPGQSHPVVPGIFHLTLVLNRGMAFGLLKGSALFFIAVAAFAVITIPILVARVRSIDALSLVSLGLITGGAAGNLIDRLRLGYVIDFFDFRIWPVFNLADSSITIGALLLAARFFFRQHTLTHPAD